MSLPYSQYHITNDGCDVAFHHLLRAPHPYPNPSEIQMIKNICAEMRDLDVSRVITLTQYLGDRDPDNWRARAPRWSNREARFVINCLRWEYYRAQTVEALNMEDEERKVRDGPTGQQQDQQQPPPPSPDV